MTILILSREEKPQDLEYRLKNEFKFKKVTNEKWVKDSITLYEHNISNSEGCRYLLRLVFSKAYKSDEETFKEISEKLKEYYPDFKKITQ